MAQSCIKDSAITYDEFENLYSDLSLREKYEVVNILYENGINLVDEHIENESSVFDSDDGSYLDELIEGDDSVDFAKEAFFKDSGYSDAFFDTLTVNNVVHQSNEILCNLIQQGNRQAAQDLCVKNRALIDRYANAYIKKYGHGLDFEDLEQVGFIGLLRAAEKYNVNKGAFSTYAVHWIKQAISREIIDNGFMIRIPVHMMDRINKVTKLEYQCSTEDTLDEKVQFIAQNTGLEENEILECIALRNNVLVHTSLATLVGEDEESELGDFLPADDEEDPVSAEVMRLSLKSAMEKVLSQLTERERTVLMLRNGWDNGVPMTLEQVSHVFNVTRERIRQIEVKALRKLRHPSISNPIKVYLED